MRDVWATSAGRRCLRSLLSAFKAPPRTVCSQYSHVFSVIACCPRESNPTLHDVWSTFARHRCHRLVSSARVELYRARCVAHARTSSLSSPLILGDRSICYYYRRDVRSMFARRRCLYLLSSGSDPTALDVWSMSARPLVNIGDRTLSLLLSPRCVPMFAHHRCHRLCSPGIGPFRYYYSITAMCGQCSHVIASDCRESDPLRTYTRAFAYRRAPHARATTRTPILYQRHFPDSSSVSHMLHQQLFHVTPGRTVRIDMHY